MQWPASNHIDLQRNPLTEEPESPSVSVAGRHRVHLLTHPVEGLVVATGLVDAATMPVDRSCTTVVSMVVSMVTAWRGTRAVASPLVCTGRSQADAEKSRNTDSGSQCRYRYCTLESHLLTPFLVNVAVFPHAE